MKNTKRCPVCGSTDVIRVPDDAHRYLSNGIFLTRALMVKRIPVARYVCHDCGYLENWVENQHEIGRASCRERV